MGIFINKENNKHPCAGAQRSKLSKPKTMSVVDIEDNTNNHSVAPTLCHGEGKYLSTMETIIFNNDENNENNDIQQWEQ